MRVHPQSTLNRRPAARRAGLAQVELALALPLLAAMWMILHTACDVGVARSETTIAARHDAWRKIGGPVSNKTLAAGGQSVDQILSPDSSGAGNRGLLEGQATRTAKSHLPGLLDDPVASGKHVVFDGCWDYRTLSFESRGEHPPLRVTRRVRAFTGFGFALGIFRSLAGF